MFLGLGMTIVNGTTAASSPAPITIIFDDFNRADNTSLGTATSGQVWTNTNFGVLSNQCYRVIGSPIAFMTVGAANGSVFWTEGAIGEAGQFYGAIFRRLNGGAYWRFVVLDGNYLLQKVNPSPTTIATVPNTRAPGNIYRAVFIGDNIRLYVNGVLKVNIVDAFNNTQVSTGLVAASSVNMRIDDFTHTTA